MPKTKSSKSPPSPPIGMELLSLHGNHCFLSLSSSSCFHFFTFSPLVFSPLPSSFMSSPLLFYVLSSPLLCPLLSSFMSSPLFFYVLSSLLLCPLLSSFMSSPLFFYVLSSPLPLLFALLFFNSVLRFLSFVLMFFILFLLISLTLFPSLSLLHLSPFFHYHFPSTFLCSSSLSCVHVPHLICY